jgi:hypothetical protein
MRLPQFKTLPTPWTAVVPVFYRDWKRNVDVMEQPDGRKFEVCFIAGAPRESNYRVVRELDETAT